MNTPSPRRLWSATLLFLFSLPALAGDISGQYDVTVQGTNFFLDRTPQRTPINDTTTLSVTQNGSDIVMEFGTFGSASSATIFKGEVGNNQFSAIWWHSGSPNETKVLWGRVNGDKLSGMLIYPRVSGREGLVPGWVEVKFEATPRPVLRAPRAPLPVPEAALPQTGVREDCLSFGDNITMQREGDQWLLSDGRSRMLMFPNNDEAWLALRILRHYRLDKHCFVGRPQPSMEYFLKGTSAPSGAMQGEDCITITGTITLKSEGSQWLMSDGRSRMRMFPNEQEARDALAIINKYGFTHTCYVGRPDPSMTYFRR